MDSGAEVAHSFRRLISAVSLERVGRRLGGDVEDAAHVGDEDGAVGEGRGGETRVDVGVTPETSLLADVDGVILFSNHKIGGKMDLGGDHIPAIAAAPLRRVGGAGQDGDGAE